MPRIIVRAGAVWSGVGTLAVALTSTHLLEAVFAHLGVQPLCRATMPSNLSLTIRSLGDCAEMWVMRAVDLGEGERMLDATCSDTFNR